MKKLVLSSVLLLLSAVASVDASAGKHRFVAGSMRFDVSNCVDRKVSQDQCDCFVCCDNVTVNPRSCRDCCFSVSPATLSVRPGVCCNVFNVTLSLNISFLKPFCCEPVIFLNGDLESFTPDCVLRQRPTDLISISSINRIASNITAEGFTAIVQYVITTCDQHNDCEDVFAFISDYLNTRGLSFQAVVSCKERESRKDRDHKRDKAPRRQL